MIIFSIILVVSFFVFGGSYLADKYCVPDPIITRIEKIAVALVGVQESVVQLQKAEIERLYHGVAGLAADFYSDEEW